MQAKRCPSRLFNTHCTSAYVPGGLEPQVINVIRLGAQRLGRFRAKAVAAVVGLTAHAVASGSAATYGWPTTPALRLGMRHEDQRCTAWSTRVPRLQPPVAL